jgi:hypothetical protein
MTVSEKDRIDDPIRKSFDFQLDLLKTEIDIIDKAISRLDGITQTIKNWAIAIWTGVITVALSDPDLRRYIANSVPMTNEQMTNEQM